MKLKDTIKSVLSRLNALGRIMQYELAPIQPGEKHMPVLLGTGPFLGYTLYQR